VEHKELTETIIGCAYRVYNKMGFGFLESVYEKCLIIELRREGLDAQSQKPITVYYEDEMWASSWPTLSSMTRLSWS
jgi:GxxExxY protein